MEPYRNAIQQLMSRKTLTKITRKASWVIIGRISTQLLSLVAIYMLANYTSETFVGTYNYLLSVISIVTVVSLSGLNWAISRSSATAHDGTFTYAKKMRLRWSLLSIFILISIAIWYFFQGNAELGWMFFILAALSPLFSTLSILSFKYWDGREEYKRSSMLQIFYYSINAGSLIIAVLFTQNPLILVMVLFGVPAIQSLSMIWYTQKYLRNTDVDHGTIRLGKHLTLIELVEAAGNHIDKILIWQFLGPASVAIYFFAKTPLSKLRQLIPLRLLSLPRLSTHSFTADYKKKFFMKYLLLTLVSTIIAIGFYVLTPLIFKILFPAYLESIPFFRALLIIIPLHPAIMLSTTFIAKVASKELYIDRMSNPLIRIVLFAIFIPLYGLWGAVAAFILSEIIGAIIALILYVRLTPEQT